MDALGPFEPNIHAYEWVCFTFPVVGYALQLLLQVRSPRLGDKFLKYEWAKGCSGLFGVSRELPFHNSRSDPDIVIKPHAFPSRQTTRYGERNP